MLPKGRGRAQANLQAIRIEAGEKRFSHQRRRSEALLCDRSYNNQNYERLLFYVVSEKAQPGREGMERQGRKSGRINMDIIMSDINFKSAALNYLK